MKKRLCQIEPIEHYSPAPGIQILAAHDYPDLPKDLRRDLPESGDDKSNYAHGIIQIAAESLEDLTAFLTSPDGSPRGVFQDRPASRKNKPADDWDLGAGWDGALAMAREGWAEGRRGIAIAAASLPGDFVPCPPVDYDLAGDLPDLPSFLAGDPEHFETDREDQIGRARIVRMIVPLTASCAVNARNLYNRGAAIASAIDALESNGIRVELEAISCHERGSDFCAAIVRHRVKEACAHLSIDRLAVSICHPAIFRRIHFAGLEAMGELTLDRAKGKGDFPISELRSGYGAPRRLRRMDLEPEGTIQIPAIGDDPHGEEAYSTPEGARSRIAAIMADQGLSLTFQPSPATGS